MCPRIQASIVFLIAGLFGCPCSAQVATSLEEIFPSTGDPVSVEVDVTVTVNYWERNWHLLFVQDGGVAIFVELPDKTEENAPDLKLGTKIRVEGRFHEDTGTITANRVVVVAQGEPVAPLPIDFDEITLGDYWSKRVRCRGKVESALVENNRVQLILRDGETRYAARIKRKFDDEAIETIVGAEVSFTGTLSCLLDPEGRLDSFMCHAMPDDQFDIIKPGQSFRPELVEKSIADFLEQRPRSDQQCWVTGQVANVNYCDFFVIEDKQHRTLSIYGPYEGDLKEGDVVRVLACSKESPPPQFVAMPPLTTRPDSRGRKADLFAELVIVDHTSFLPPARILSASEVVAEKIHRGRATLNGTLVSISSSGFNRRLVLDDGGILYVCSVFSGDEFGDLDLGRARTLQITGLIEKAADVDEDIAFEVRLNSIDQLTVKSKWAQIDQRTAAMIAGGMVLLLMGGAFFLWRLRRRVGHQEKNLANVIARLNSSYDAVQEALLVVDTNGRVIATNSKTPNVLGIERRALLDDNGRTENGIASVAHRINDAFQSGDQFSDAWSHVQANPNDTMSLELRSAGYPKRTVLVYTAPVIGDQGVPEGRVWAFDDVSERKNLEDKLVQSQKMEAVGRLAGGVAHDFNNLLLAMSANIELTRLQPQRSVAEVDSYLSEADKAARRATKLIRHLLGFSRKTSLDMRVYNPNEIVDRVAVLLERTLDAFIELEIVQDSELGNAKFDESQLEQVLVNICLNARDAIEDRGSIVINTNNVAGSDSPLRVDSVRVRVADDGIGMSKEVRERIFDPFFTTKERGKGTGLGLAMSFGIIEQHGGVIVCESQPVNGTIFDVYLPRCFEAGEATELTSTRVEAIRSVAEGTEILVVDDEELVRNCLAESLRLKGFKVATAENGQVALEYLSGEQRVELVLLDYSMPVMSGRETLAEISMRFPHLPVVMCSGFVHEIEDFRMDSSDQPFAVVSKPFQLSKLIKVIDNAFQATAAKDVSVR